MRTRPCPSILSGINQLLAIAAAPLVSICSPLRAQVSSPAVGVGRVDVLPGKIYFIGAPFGGGTVTASSIGSVSGQVVSDPSVDLSGLSNSAVQFRPITSVGIIDLDYRVDSFSSGVITLSSTIPLTNASPGNPYQLVSPLTLNSIFESPLNAPFMTAGTTTQTADEVAFIPSTSSAWAWTTYPRTNSASPQWSSSFTGSPVGNLPFDYGRGFSLDKSATSAAATLFFTGAAASHAHKIRFNTGYTMWTPHDSAAGTTLNSLPFVAAGMFPGASSVSGSDQIMEWDVQTNSYIIYWRAKTTPRKWVRAGYGLTDQGNVKLSRLKSYIIYRNGSPVDVVFPANPNLQPPALTAAENSVSPAFIAAWAVPANQQGPGDDPDADGLTNAVEYHRGTNPMAADSAVPPGGFSISRGATQGVVVISVIATPGISYFIDRYDLDTASPVWTTIASHTAGLTPSALSVTAAIPATSAAFEGPLSYFRVRTELPDTDGDGTPDWDETAWGLNPNDSTDAAADPDGDGLTSLQEFTAGTHPLIADTDGDGVLDAAEVALGTPPATPGHLPVSHPVTGLSIHAPLRRVTGF